MKKTMCKITTSILSLILIFCVAIVPSAAVYGYTTQMWDTIWSENDAASVHLSPGSDATQMNVAWFGSEAAVNPTVYVSSAFDDNYTAYTGTVESSEYIDSVVYKVTVTDLLPASEYKYYCVSGSFQSEIFYFQTAHEGDFDAVFVSDIHISDNEEADSVKNSAGHYNSILMQGLEKNDNVSLIISAGDNADRGLYSEYTGLFATPVTKSIPFASVSGNHDYKAEIYPVVMNHPNTFNVMVKDKNGGDYWFVKGDVLFLMLNGSWASSTDHKNFVKQAVEANPDVKWRVAVMHQDLYGGHLEHRESENTLMRAMFAPIFDEFKVDLVLMGHSHIYSRTHVLKDNKVVESLTGDSSVVNAQGTIYLTSASICRTRDSDLQGSTRVAFDYQEGANIYNLMSFTNDSIKITAYRDDAQEPIDEFEIIKTNESIESTSPVNPFYDIVHLLSYIYAIIRNLGQLLGID